MDTGDDVFTNVTPSGNNQVEIVTSNISFVDTANVGNGTLVATRADNNWVWIARWSAGTVFYDGAGETAGGDRMYFSAGANAPTGYAGQLNLNAAGQTMFLNAVDSMAISERSTLGLLGIGATGFLAYAWRRRKVA